jgi:hypothetical protein
MDILHWWQIKLGVIQLLWLLAVGWGVHWLRRNRRPVLALQKTRSPRASYRTYSRRVSFRRTNSSRWTENLTAKI